jgi:hypothetical protein
MKAKILLKSKKLLLLLPLLAFLIGTSMVSQAQEPVPAECNATVVTDKDDYFPGEVALISGSGWLPGETVQITLFSTNLATFEYFTVEADGDGNFTGLNYDILEIHLGERFELEAVGLTSKCKAIWYFTDGNSLTLVIGSQTGIVYSGAGGTVTYNITGTRDNAANSFTTNLITSTLPTGVTASFNPSSFTFPSQSGGTSQTSDLTLTVASTVVANTYNFTVSGSGGGTSSNVTLIVSACTAPSISTQPTAQSITYGANTSFSVVASGTTPLNYQWQVNTGSGFTNLAEGGVYSGTTTSTLTLTKPSVSMSTYKYRCIISNVCGSVTSNEATLTVNARPITITADAKSKVYGAADPALTYQITAGSLAGSDAFTGALTRTTGENVGTYAITQGTLALNNNYNLTFIGANLTIGQLAVAVNADAKTKTYGDVDPALTFVSVPAVGTTLANGLTIGFTGSLTRNAGEDVGSYAILQGDIANANYAISFTGANLSIGQLAVAVNAEAKTKTYGDVDPTLTFVSVPAVGTTLANGLTIGFTGSLTRNAGEDVGSYAILQGSVANANYAISFTGANLSIGQLAVAVNAEAKTKTYGDVDPALTFVSVPAVGTTLANGLTVGFTGSLTRNAGEDVGSYAILQGSVANANYAISFTGANLSIGQLAVAVNADAKTKTYGDVDPALTFVSVPAVGTTLANGLTVGFTGSLTRNAGEDVGSYAILQGSVANANYAISFTGANLSIGQLAVAVNADAKTKTYGDVDPALTFVSVPAVGTTLANGLTVGFTGSLTRNAGEDVGSYAILQGGVANTNYAISYTGANLSIGQLAVTITADAKTKFCGQVDPPLTFVSSPAVGTVLANGEIIGFTGTLSRVAGEGVGFYNILNGSLTNLNYAITYVGARLEILGVTIDASGSSVPVPVGSPATLRAVVSPAVSGVSVNFRVTNEANTVIFNQTVTTDANGQVTATIPSSSLVLGVYMVVATAGSGCATSTAYIPVFDASGSFVTGGGWIWSPAGALTSDASVVGKANFGFVSRYRKGSSQVDGNTEFQFNAGNINFKSTFHETGSLVISGRRATYRGSGTVNGASGFKFTLVAIDGHLNNGTGPDQFRIKITNGAGGVVYDNGLNAAENTDVSTALGGGSIVIHEVKRKAAEIEIQDSGVSETLVKAYPNPFSDRVFFDLKFAKGANAMLEIFDLRGAKLGTLLNQRVEAGQQYRLEYSPVDVAPGMLMYRLVVDGEVMNGRILYQKQR